MALTCTTQYYQNNITGNSYYILTRLTDVLESEAQHKTYFTDIMDDSCAGTAVYTGALSTKGAP